MSNEKDYHPIVVILILIALPFMYLIECLIDLKDRLIEGEHYLRNGRGHQ